ncbi:uncharacterized protein LOC115884109 isoform X2 [Sitophilus oryzae]|nr:uncharacterized protein LOC115884109 isoform X2 [Sitophilus oryzae]XP_030758459.1 uncharacterized protein LOC115884109 isoform X2 [Sitophilus oryzae]XP_030758460.1 uncharacterized protein LOC115884109 isoform X2 [Sitophilus oryzae]
MYISVILNKSCNPNAEPAVERETVATALVNGNNGLGSVVGKFCMDLAIRKAKDVGISMVTAYGSNHFGIAGIYSLQAMKQNCVGICFTNTSPVMLPTRGRQSALGTNPLSFGAGNAHDQVVLDMATTTVAVGKLEIKKRKGESIPKGWACDNDGNVTSDPSVGMKSGKLLPLGGEEENGGYKGYGLSLLVDVMSGIFSGSNYGTNVPMFGGVETSNLGQTFIAINPEVFAPGFQDRLSDLLGLVRNTEPKDKTKPVLVPGDPERIHMAQVDSQGGLRYIQDQRISCAKLAEKLKIQPMKSFELK